MNKTLNIILPKIVQIIMKHTCRNHHKDGREGYQALQFDNTKDFILHLKTDIARLERGEELRRIVL